MAHNEKKIISIILEECEGIEERCVGYRKEILETISDIVLEERRHRVSATNIQTKVDDKCNTAARYLVRIREQGAGTKELVS